MRVCRRVNDAVLIQLWYSRVSDKEMASRMGHHIGVLRRRGKKLGLPTSRRIIWNKDAPAPPSPIGGEQP